MLAAGDNVAPSPSAVSAPTKHEIPEGYKILKEGKASILQKGNDVFYNEAQVTETAKYDFRDIPWPRLHWMSLEQLNRS